MEANPFRILCVGCKSEALIKDMMEENNKIKLVNNIIQTKNSKLSLNSHHNKI